MYYFAEIPLFSVAKIPTQLHAREFASPGEVKCKHIEINGIQKHQLKTAMENRCSVFGV